MRFGNLIIRGFGSIVDAKVDLSRDGVWIVQGKNKDQHRSNGAGKTTIFDALCWCLYGRTPKTSKVSEVVSAHAKKCMVGLEIISDKKYLVVRSRKGNSHKVDVTCDGEDIRGHDVRDTQAIIGEILGISYETFLRSHLFPQKPLPSFSSMTDGQLKEYFLNELLGVGWIRTALDLVRKDKLTKSYREQEIDRNLASLESRLSFSVAKEVRLKEQATQWHVEHEERLEILRREIMKWSNAMSLNHGAAEKVKELQERYDLIQDYPEAMEKYNRLSTICQKLLYDYEHNKKSIDELKAQVDDITVDDVELGTPCPTCGTIITEEHVPFLIRERTVQTKNIKEKLAELVEKNKEIKRELTTKRQSLSEAKQDAQAHQDAMFNRASIQRDIISMKASEVEERNARESYVHAKEELKRVSEEENPYQGMMDDMLKENEQIRQEMSALSAERDKLVNDMKGITFWEYGFGTQGLQSYMLEQFTPVLNEQTSAILHQLSGGELRATFSTVTKLKSGEYREKFSLDIENVTGASGYNLLSGGEAQRVDIAVSMAMGNIVRSRTAKKLDFLCLDEPFKSLDDSGIDAVMKYLYRNVNDTPVFLITHTDVDTSFSAGTIEVTKENGVSRVALINKR